MRNGWMVASWPIGRLVALLIGSDPSYFRCRSLNACKWIHVCLALPKKEGRTIGISCRLFHCRPYCQISLLFIRNHPGAGVGGLLWGSDWVQATLIVDQLMLDQWATWFNRFRFGFDTIATLGWRHSLDSGRPFNGIEIFTYEFMK